MSDLSDESCTLFPGKDHLLALCDDVRTSIHKTKSFGPRRLEISEFLSSLLQGEAGDSLCIDFHTIHHARLDKLLCDILNPKYRPSQTPISFKADEQIAENLQRQWRRRFSGKYFALDQMRYSDLVQRGLLQDVYFDQSAIGQPEMWKVKPDLVPPEPETVQSIPLFTWWLNFACARRDGMFPSDIRTATKNQHDVMALTLMTGKESLIDNASSTYIREGTLADMQPELMTKVGSKFRILRGYQLESTLAPEAGVRYDGLYMLRQYGHKYDEPAAVHRLYLILERMDDQKSLKGSEDVPRPSQLDDWAVYQTLQCSLVRQSLGESGFLKWKMSEAEQSKERELWRNVVNFGASVDGNSNASSNGLP